MTVLYLRVVDARYDRPMPDRVLIAPVGIESRDVSRGPKPRPEMMRVLKVVKPPLGTCKLLVLMRNIYVFIGLPVGR